MKGKRILAALLALVMVLSTTTVIFAKDWSEKQTFKDVGRRDWSHGYVENLADQDIVHGYGDGTYGPLDNLTRQQAAKMIAIAAGLDFKGKTAKFPDVPKDSEFSGYIAALVEKGAISGFTDGTFRPTALITRSQAAKMIAAAFGLAKGDFDVDFPDTKDLDPKDKALVDLLASLGIVKGYEDGKEFRPFNNVSRAQFAKMLAIAQATAAVQRAEADGATDADLAQAKKLVDNLPDNQDIGTKKSLEGRLDDLEEEEEEPGPGPVVVQVSAISVTTPPTKTKYTAGESLDLTGLVIKITKTDNSTEEVVLADFVAKGITTSPVNGAELATTDTKVTITHTESGKTVEQNITVVESVEPATFAVTIDGDAAVTTDYTVAGADDLNAVETGTTLKITAVTAITVNGEEVAVGATKDVVINKATTITINKQEVEPATFAVTFVAASGAESLDGATITVYSDAERTEVVTDYSAVEAGTYYYTIAKAGFETLEGSVVITDQDEEVEVTLVVEVDALAVATAAVETAEATPTQGNVDTAQGLVTALPDGAEKTALQGRIDAVQDIIDAAEALAESKTSAKAELAGYVNAENYTENADDLAAAIAAGKDNIDAATTTDAVATALADAKLAIDEIKTDAELAAEALAAATSAVETAEATPTQGNVDVAQDLVTALPDGAEKTALQDRIDAVQDIIDALAAVNEATTTAAMRSAIEENAEILGLDMTSYQELLPARQPAVSVDLVANKGEGYTLDSLKSTFDAIVATRHATQASMDKVNDATSAEALGMTWVTDLLAQFKSADEVYDYHSGIALSEKISALEGLVTRYNDLPEANQAAVLVAVWNNGEDYSRSQATTDALATALTVQEELIEAEEVTAAKAAFLDYLNEEVADIDAADVTIEDEDISVSFKWNATVDEVYQAANGLIDALKGELEAATLTVIRTEEDSKSFDLKESNVASKIAQYLLNGMSPENFLKDKATVTAAYTAVATNEAGVSFNLGGELKFTVGQPSAEDIAQAKEAFLTYLNGAVATIDAADVSIDEEENITASFKWDATVDEVYQAANGLIDALKGELEAATLTVIPTEEDSKSFDLKESNVASKIAQYLLNGMSPENFLKDKAKVTAAYTAVATNEAGVSFNLGGSLIFTVGDPSAEDIAAAKAAFLDYLNGAVATIDAAEVTIDEEDITASFKWNATVDEVYQAANGLIDALKGELEAATLTVIRTEEDSKSFDLKESNVASKIAQYLLNGMSPENFLKDKATVTAAYTAAATNEEGVSFNLGGSLIFTVGEPSEEEIAAAKTAFLDYLNGAVATIDAAEVTIDEEDITASFKWNATVDEVYQAANGLIDALKGELEAATLTVIRGEEESKSFDLKESNVASKIAQYLLNGMSPENFLKDKATVTAAYTAVATNEEGVSFNLGGSLIFTVGEPSEEEIAAAKTAFLDYLNGAVATIDAAKVTIDEEDITASFKWNATVDEVYQAANGLIDALKGELEAATLTVIRGEEESKSFDLKESNVASKIAQYLLNGMSPENFLKDKATVTAAYTAVATNEEGVSFNLGGSLIFTVGEPSEEEIAAAKTAFLDYLNGAVATIDAAEVTIDEEDITASFKWNATVDEVYQAANGLIDALKGELEAATLTVIPTEEDSKSFDLKESNVASKIAQYLLNGMSPENFLKDKATVTAAYTAVATNEEGVSFNLGGSLIFTVGEPSEEEIAAAKTAFLDYLNGAVATIDAAEVTIDEEDISVSFNWNATVDEVYQAANGLIDALKGELEAATLTVIRGEEESKSFDLKESNVASKIAQYLLNGLSPENFLKDKATVTAAYTAVATNEEGVSFNLGGSLIFTVGEPSEEEIAAAKTAFLDYLNGAVATIDAAEVTIDEEDITASFKWNATVDEVYQAANGLIDALKGELEAATLTVIRGEEESKSFDLKESNVASKIAQYLLNGLSPENFLKDKATVTAAYTAVATNEEGVSFNLGGEPKFTVGEPSEEEIAAAKTAFLDYLNGAVATIDAAEVTIDEEDITASFKWNATVDEVYQAANGLIDALKGELEAATLTVIPTEEDSKSFDLKESNVASKIAQYLLNGMSPENFLKDKAKVTAAYTAVATNEEGVSFNLGGSLIFTVGEPSEEEIAAAKTAFLDYLNGAVATIDAADVSIDEEENITASFKWDATVDEVYQAANGLIDALKGELEAATLTVIPTEEDSKSFDLKESNVASKIAQYLLNGMSPENFLKDKATVTAAYTAAATNEEGVSFNLGGSLIFTVGEPSEEEIAAAKTAFLDYLNGAVATIDAAEVTIDEEDITASFKWNATVDEVYQAANGLIDALKGELEAATLTVIRGEEESKSFDLKESNVASKIAQYLLNGMSPENFLKDKATVTAAYTAVATNEEGVSFNLGGSLIFTVGEPSEEEIAAAKTAFLDYLNGAVATIDAAEVTIDEEDITASFKWNATVDEVYQAANGLIDALKGELEAATLTVIRGEEESKSFDLKESNVASKIAQYLLNGLSPENFLKDKATVTAAYTAVATNEEGVSFNLGGELKFTVGQPSAEDIAQAKEAFLTYLNGAVATIDAADVSIDEEENITASFKWDATVDEVYQAANGLIDALKGELEAATLTVIPTEEDSKSFDLKESNVASKIAQYLLNGMSPENFLKDKAKVTAAYTAVATNEEGVSFNLGGSLIFTVGEPSEEEIAAAKTAFLDYLNGAVATIDAADVSIDEEENITASFKWDATVDEVYQAANGLIDALKGELEAATLTVIPTEEDSKSFDLKESNVASKIAQYLLNGMSPENFLKDKATVTAAYTAAATNEEGVSFNLGGSLIFTVGEPSEEEIAAAKTAFLDYLNGAVATIDAAEVTIDEEDITASFKWNATVDEVYQAANGLIDALKGELEAATLTVIRGEEESKSFDLKESNVASKIAQYLLNGMSPENFLKDKATVTAAYTAVATNEEGVSFNLGGSLIFTVGEPSEEEIAAAKTAFLDYLNGAVATIDAAKVTIDEEDITASFKWNATVDEVYQAANGLIDALKGELEAATLTVIRGEEESKSFDLKESNVASKIAQYLLNGMSPENFLKDKATVTAAYTAVATNEEGVSFNLGGSLIFTVGEPSEEEIAAAKTAFLDYLNGAVATIDAAEVTIDEEDITASFKWNATVDEVYQAANGLIDALKGELEAATLTVIPTEEDSKSFDLKESNVASKIAQYLLNGMSPENFLKDKATVTAAYTAVATNEEGVSFNLGGSLIFTVGEPSEEEIAAAKTAFLDYLNGAVATIDAAEVTIDEEDISVSFNWNATVDEVYQAANGLIDALKGELEAATLTVIRGEEESKSFDLKESNVASKIAQYLLNGLSPENFLKDKATVTAAYTAAATNEEGVSFNLGGELKFTVGQPSAEDIAQAKEAFLTYLNGAVATIDAADVSIDEEENITASFKWDATVDEVYQAANGLIDALKGELEAATLTVIPTEEDSKSFDLKESNVASKIAQYLLNGMSPENFLKDKATVTAAYTAAATNEEGVSFNLGGSLIFTVGEPSEEEIAAAKTAFLDYLNGAVATIDAAEVTIDEEDITASFKWNATVDEVYQAANGLIDALKGELEAATLTVIRGEEESKSFDLKESNVASKIAQYLLNGLSPENFLKDKATVTAAYTAAATNEEGVSFNLGGELKFTVGQPSAEDIAQAKEAFLTYLNGAVATIDAAEVTIDEEDITASFKWNATVDEVYQAANGLIDALKGELEAATLTVIRGEEESKSFDLKESNVASKIAQYLLNGLSPENFLKDKATVTAAYTAVATNEEGVSFNLGGSLVFTVGDPTEEEIAAAITAAIEEANDGDTITLIADVSFPDGLTIDKIVNLEFAGFTITGDVTITSVSEGTLVIGQGKIDGDLTVNAPNASVKNNATVTGEIYIDDVKDGTWTEHSDGNTLTVNDTNGMVLKIVGNVKAVTISQSAAGNITVTFDANAEIESMEINAPVTLVSPKPVSAVIAEGVKVTVKEDEDSESVDIVGSGSDEEEIDYTILIRAAAIEAAETAIANLPSVEEVGIEDAAAVAEAKALVAAVKALDPEAEVEGVEVITELEAKIAEIQEINTVINEKIKPAFVEFAEVINGQAPKSKPSYKLWVEHNLDDYEATFIFSEEAQEMGPYGGLQGTGLKTAFYALANVPEILGASAGGSKVSFKDENGDVRTDDGFEWDLMFFGEGLIGDVPKTIAGIIGTEQTMNLDCRTVSGYEFLMEITFNFVAAKDQAAPTELLGIASTSFANNDGKITGTTTAMEYKLKGAKDWKKATETEITGLAAGTYEVRYTAKEGYSASPITEIVVGSELADAKDAAKIELHGYVKSADYVTNKDAVLAAIKSGLAAIDEAETFEAVNAALANAKAVIDEIKTDAQLAEEAANIAITNTLAAVSDVALDFGTEVTEANIIAKLPAAEGIAYEAVLKNGDTWTVTVKDTAGKGIPQSKDIVVTVASNLDQEAADVVIGLIAILPEEGNLSIDNLEAVENAEEAFNGLSDDAKDLVGPDTVAELNSAIDKMSELVLEDVDVRLNGAVAKLTNLEQAGIEEVKYENRRATFHIQDPSIQAFKFASTGVIPLFEQMLQDIVAMSLNGGERMVIDNPMVAAVQIVVEMFDGVDSEDLMDSNGDLSINPEIVPILFAITMGDLNGKSIKIDLTIKPNNKEYQETYIVQFSMDDAIAVNYMVSLIDELPVEISLEDGEEALMTALMAVENAGAAYKNLSSEAKNTFDANYPELVQKLNNTVSMTKGLLLELVDLKIGLAANCISGDVEAVYENQTAKFIIKNPEYKITDFMVSSAMNVFGAMFEEVTGEGLAANIKVNGQYDIPKDEHFEKRIAVAILGGDPTMDADDIQPFLGTEIFFKLGDAMGGLAGKSIDIEVTFKPFKTAYVVTYKVEFVLQEGLDSNVEVNQGADVQMIQIAPEDLSADEPAESEEEIVTEDAVENEASLPVGGPLEDETESDELTVDGAAKEEMDKAEIAEESAVETDESQLEGDAEVIEETGEEDAA